MVDVIRSDAKVIVIPVGIGVYRSPPAALSTGGRRAFENLPEIKKDLRLLKKLFDSPPYLAAGFQVLRPITGQAGSILDRLQTLAEQLSEVPGRLAILLWAGHAEPLGGRDLRLATTNSYTPMTAADGMRPADLVDKLSAGRAKGLYVILDVCQAGLATGDLAATAAQRMLDQPPARGTLPGFAAVCSAQPYERAKDGIFAGVLERVLRTGPSIQAQRLITEQGFGGFAFNRFLTPRELDSVLQAEFQTLRESDTNLQQPSPTAVGAEFPLFPNPMRQPGAQPQLMDDPRRFVRPADANTHFLPKARGLEPGEEGWNFVGRLSASRKIVTFLAGDPAPENNLMVLTGTGGVGKSAILGRAVALSDADYRGSIARAGWSEVTDRRNRTLPPLDHIDAALHLRGLSGSAVASALGELVGVGVPPIGGELEPFIAQLAAGRRVDERPTTLVLDALDEAEDPQFIAESIVRPLADRGCRIIVGTRPTAIERGAHDLLSSLGDSTVLDLLQDDHSDDDIAAYVEQRLNAVEEAPYARNTLLRRYISDGVRDRAGGRFLYAKITVDGLLRNPITTVQDVESALTSSVGQAFARDLAELDAQFRVDFGRTDSGASALAQALAWSEGQGVPLRDQLWPLTASAIAQNSSALTDEHARWLIRHAGRYIVESGDGEQAVYRLYHESLHEHFRSMSGPSAAELRGRIAEALLRHVDNAGGWMLANPYVVRHLTTYLAGRPSELEQVCLDPAYLTRALSILGVNALAAILDVARHNAPGLALVAVAKAVRRSRVALARDPGQLATQLIARLSDEPDPALRTLVARLPSVAPRIWLAPVAVQLGWQEELQTMQTFPGNVRAVASANIDGEPHFFIGVDKNIVKWNPQNADVEQTISNDDRRVTHLAVGTLNGRIVVAASSHDGGIAVRDLHTAQVTGPPLSGRAWPLAFAAAPTGFEYTIGVEFEYREGIHCTVLSDDGTALFAAESRQQLCTVDGRIGVITLSGQQVVVSLDSAETLLFDLESLDINSGAALCVDEYLGRPVLAIADSASVIHVLDTDGHLRAQTAVNFPIRAIAMATVDSQLVVAAANDSHGPDMAGYVALRQPLAAVGGFAAPPIQLRNVVGIGRIGSRLVALTDESDPVDVITMLPVQPTAAHPLTVLAGVSESFGPADESVYSDFKLELFRDSPAQWPITAVGWGRLGDHDIQLRGSHGGVIWLYDRELKAFSGGPFAEIPPMLTVLLGK